MLKMKAIVLALTATLIPAMVCADRLSLEKPSVLEDETLYLEIETMWTNRILVPVSPTNRLSATVPVMVGGISGIRVAPRMEGPEVVVEVSAIHGEENGRLKLCNDFEPQSLEFLGTFRLSAKQGEGFSLDSLGGVDVQPVRFRLLPEVLETDSGLAIKLGGCENGCKCPGHSTCCDPAPGKCCTPPGDCGDCCQDGDQGPSVE